MFGLKKIKYFRVLKYIVFFFLSIEMLKWKQTNRGYLIYLFI